MKTLLPCEVIQIDEKSWRIEDNGVRCLLFAGTEKALLVDTGFGSPGLRGLVRDLTGNAPLMLVNSHADWDHVGGNRFFDAAYMHPSDFYAYHSGECKGLPVKALWEGDTIDLGGRTFEVIHIPGHTQGSVALLDRDNRVILCGDSICALPMYMFGTNRSPHAYIASMEKLEAFRPAFDLVYTAHGDFPLRDVVLADYYNGMRDVAAGKIQGSVSPHETAAKMYDTGKVKFMF